MSEIERLKNEPALKNALYALPEQQTLLSVIARAATDPACDIEKMERLMAMHERAQARQAEAAFAAAMSRAQAQMPRIEPDARNRQTSSDYAKYDQIDRAVRPVYTANGFSVDFDSESAGESTLTVIAHVSHAGGHSITRKIPVPCDGKGAKGGDVMTRTHATISAVSYGRSALSKMIWNLAIGSDPHDDDGNAAGGGAPGYDCTDWLEAIMACTDDDGMSKLAAELRTKSEIPGSAMKKIRQAWVAHNNALKGKANA